MSKTKDITLGISWSIQPKSFESLKVTYSETVELSDLDQREDIREKLLADLEERVSDMVTGLMERKLEDWYGEGSD